METGGAGLGVSVAKFSFGLAGRQEERSKRQDRTAKEICFMNTLVKLYYCFGEREGIVLLRKVALSSERLTIGRFPEPVKTK